MSTHTTGLAAVAITVLTWAASFPAIRIGLDGFAPIPLAALRFAIASVLVIAWLAWARPQRPSAPDALRFLLCGAIGIAAYNILLNSGQRTVSAGAASFIVNTAPVITALFSIFATTERLRLWGWIGTLVSFGGVTVIAYGQPGGLSFGSGATLISGAAVCTATYFMVQRPLIPRYGALPCAAWTLLAGTLWLSPWLPAAVDAAQAAAFPPLAAVAFLGVFPAAIGYATWTCALGHFGAARAANFLYLVPPVALALSWILRGDRPDLLTIIGGALAIGGVVLVNTKGR